MVNARTKNKPRVNWLKYSLEITPNFDCKENCGKCCKEFSLSVNEDRIKQISDHLDTPLEDFKYEYAWKENPQALPVEEIEKGKYNIELLGDWYLNTLSSKSSCSLLTDENKCSAYEVRPKACKAYPLQGEDLIGFTRLSILDDCSVAEGVITSLKELLETDKELRSEINLVISNKEKPALVVGDKKHPRVFKGIQESLRNPRLGNRTSKEGLYLDNELLPEISEWLKRE